MTPVETRAFRSHRQPAVHAGGLRGAAGRGYRRRALIVAQTVLGLVEPQSSGIGGGAFLMYYDAATGEVQSLRRPRDGT